MKKNNRGFSLVELIVVMAIMAILVGAVAPQVVKYVDKARESKDLQVISTIFTAFQTEIATSDPSITIADQSITDMANLSNTDSGKKIYNNAMKLLGSDMDDAVEIEAKLISTKGKSGDLYIKCTAGILEIAVKASSTGDYILGPITN